MPPSDAPELRPPLGADFISLRLVVELFFELEEAGWNTGVCKENPLEIGKVGVQIYVLSEDRERGQAVVVVERVGQLQVPEVLWGSSYTSLSIRYSAPRPLSMSRTRSGRRMKTD